MYKNINSERQGRLDKFELLCPL